MYYLGSIKISLWLFTVLCILTMSYLEQNSSVIILFVFDVPTYGKIH